jgi:benzoyl-CoA reductase/2-hydroxyglutaryl-CoA dehydratase subunit BcrC/BadD/HgdB
MCGVLDLKNSVKVLVDADEFWGVDSMPLVSALRAQGIPVLKLEREYRMGGEGQLRTRVQAFIESMGK